MKGRKKPRPAVWRMMALAAMLCLMAAVPVAAEAPVFVRSVTCPPLDFTLEVPQDLWALTRDMPQDDPAFTALGVDAGAVQRMLIERDMVLDVLPEDRAWEITLVVQKTDAKDLDAMNRFERRVVTDLAVRRVQGWGMKISQRETEEKGTHSYVHVLGTVEEREKELYVTVQNGCLMVFTLNVYRDARTETQSAVLSDMVESVCWKDE